MIMYRKDSIFNKELFTEQLENKGNNSRLFVKQFCNKQPLSDDVDAINLNHIVKSKTNYVLLVYLIPSETYVQYFSPHSTLSNRQAWSIGH